MPVAVGLGSDAAFRQPMALAVIGGLLSSTALSLLLVPVVFSGVDSAKKQVKDILAGPSAGSTASPGGTES
jgi:Cu/Ag efflux pump CusA